MWSQNTLTFPNASFDFHVPSCYDDQFIYDAKVGKVGLPMVCVVNPKPYIGANPVLGFFSWDLGTFEDIIPDDFVVFMPGEDSWSNSNNTYPNAFEPPLPQPNISMVSIAPNAMASDFSPSPVSVDPWDGSISDALFQQNYYERILFLTEGLNNSINGTGGYTVGSCSGLCVEGGDGGPYCMDRSSGTPCVLDQLGYDAMWVLKRVSYGEVLPLNLAAPINPPTPAPKGNMIPACNEEGNFNPFAENCQGNQFIDFSSDDSLLLRNPCRPSGTACYLTCFVWHTDVKQGFTNLDGFSWNCHELNAYQGHLTFGGSWLPGRQISGYGDEGGLPNKNYPFDGATLPDFQVTPDWRGYPTCCPPSNPDDPQRNYECNGNPSNDKDDPGVYYAAALEPDSANYLKNGVSAGCTWDTHTNGPPDNFKGTWCGEDSGDSSCTIGNGIPLNLKPSMWPYCPHLPGCSCNSNPVPGYPYHQPTGSNGCYHCY